MDETSVEFSINHSVLGINFPNEFVELFFRDQVFRNEEACESLRRKPLLRQLGSQSIDSFLFLPKASCSVSILLFHPVDFDFSVGNVHPVSNIAQQ